MKKILLALSLLGLISIAMSSCKMHEDCPAYGKSEVVSDTNG